MGESLYLRMGVASIWLIDPMHQCAYVYDAQGRRLAPTECMEIPGTPIYLPLDELFLAADRRR